MAGLKPQGDLRPWKSMTSDLQVQKTEKMWEESEPGLSEPEHSFTPVNNPVCSSEPLHCLKSPAAGGLHWRMCVDSRNVTYYWWLTPHFFVLCCFILSTEPAFSSGMPWRMMCPSRLPEHQCWWRSWNLHPLQASRHLGVHVGVLDFISFSQIPNPPGVCHLTRQWHLYRVSQTGPLFCLYTGQVCSLRRGKHTLVSFSLPVNWGYDSLFDYSLHGNIKGD